MATPILDGLWSPLDRRQLALLRDAFVHFVEMFDALCGLAFNFGGGFVTKVAISDMFEIQSSQLALSKQADTDTKPFAEKMVQDHQKTSTELKALVEGGKVKATLPSALDAEHQKMLDDLKAKSVRISTRVTIRSSSRRTGMRSRYSRLTPRAAIMLSSKAGQGRRSPISRSI